MPVTPGPGFAESPGAVLWSCDVTNMEPECLIKRPEPPAELQDV